MTFTSEEKYILERLVQKYKPEVDLKRLNPNDNYEMYAQSTLRVSAEWYATYKQQQETDWVAIEKLKREADARRLAERNAEVLDGTMTGILAGLMPKLGRTGLSVTFDVDETGAGFSAETPDLSEEVISMSYDRADRSLMTRIGQQEFVEDVSLLSGNRAPREQIAGLEAVHAYLDGLEAAREAAVGSDGD